MPGRRRQFSAAIWRGLGIGADVHGRLSFALWAVGLPLGLVLTLREWLGLVTAALATLCFLMALLGGWGFIRAVQREDRRLARELITGTLIPPGYAAIVSGHQAEPGEWVPPGFHVTMAPGQVADESGATVVGADARAYNAPGATVLGAGAQVGQRPY